VKERFTSHRGTANSRTFDIAVEAECEATGELEGIKFHQEALRLVFQQNNSNSYQPRAFYLFGQEKTWTS
jgi:hypothetical protein